MQSARSASPARHEEFRHGRQSCPPALPARQPGRRPACAQRLADRDHRPRAARRPARAQRRRLRAAGGGRRLRRRDGGRGHRAWCHAAAGGASNRRQCAGHAARLRRGGDAGGERVLAAAACVRGRSGADRFRTQRRHPGRARLADRCRWPARDGSRPAPHPRARRPPQRRRGVAVRVRDCGAQHPGRARHRRRCGAQRQRCELGRCSRGRHLAAEHPGGPDRGDRARHCRLQPLAGFRRCSRIRPDRADRRHCRLDDGVSVGDDPALGPGGSGRRDAVRREPRDHPGVAPPRP